MERLESERTHAELEQAIAKHWRQLWIEAGNDELAEHGVIPQWLVVVYYQDLSESRSLGDYSVETSQLLPPHSINGLLDEGAEWVAGMREGGIDD